MSTISTREAHHPGADAVTTKTIVICAASIRSTLALMAKSALSMEQAPTEASPRSRQDRSRSSQPFLANQRLDAMAGTPARERSAARAPRIEILPNEIASLKQRRGAEAPPIGRIFVRTHGARLARPPPELMDCYR